MQSFRERSGFHGNQHCYQQEPQELSRLESYRHHHSQSRQGYEPHSLAAAGMSTAGAGSKDCYGQQTYPVYTSATQKKPYRGAKTPNQHLQAGYSNHMGTGYTAQYISEGHLQQKWDESAQMTQFEQDMVGRLESGASGSSQYLEQNMLAISQSQCHLPSQSSASTYTSPHQQGLPPNPAPSPLMYPQGHLHFPQHSQPSSSSSSSYMEKCNTMSHSYKGYGIPSNTQYGRQLSNHSSLKQSGYRPQNNYGYQQAPSRSGFEQSSMQGMSSTQENLQKFQHYNQPQQNYCITDISVRSPEQYYQTCSPSSSHSPARSVGRSPSYNSTPSPLMPNPDSFQYGQPPINPGASSSTNLQDQNMLMPPHTHSSPSVNHQSQSYSGSMKERFSEKLLSNPSLWSLNALTSQVENISNNVQQLLLSEALMANKKTSKRNPPKKGEDYRGQLKGMEESSCPDNQHGPPPSDAYNIHRSMTAELQEGGYSSSTEEQMDKNYYYFGQEKGQANTQTHSRLSLDTVSTCSLNSADDASVRSGDSVQSLQSVTSDDNLNRDPRVQRVLTGEEPNSSLHCIRDERSPISVTAPSPMKQESNSPPDIKRSESTLKENFEESAWTERMADEDENGQRKLSAEHECKGEIAEKQEKWLEDEKSPSLFHKINKTVLEEGYSYETEDNIYQGLQNKYDSDKGNSEMDCYSELNHKCNEGAEIKAEHFKSEPQTNDEMFLKTSPGNSGSDLCLTEKEEQSKSENSVESPICTEGPVDTQQTPVLSHNLTEMGDEKESLTTSEEVINNRARPQESFAEVCSTFEETGNMPQVNTETAESLVLDTQHRGSERRSAICDIAPQPHTAKSGFSVLNEKTTPLAQARDHHIDRSDAKVLEPDSPQLPGKSIMHSAPSWADTPPSPKKGDEDMEPGISCPSAVTPSAKPEPMTPSSHTRMFGKKHARGRRRLMHSSIGIRRQLSVERDNVPTSAQNPSMPSSKSTLIPDQMETAHQDNTGQTQKLVTESLPSRMCTRSYGSQSSPKVCPQERRKPGPKPGPKSDSKPGLKPGPKPSLKSNLKPGQKSNSKPGPKPSAKPEAIPSVKSGPKQSLKCTGSTENAKPSSKPGPKPGAKSASKQGSKPGALAEEIFVPKLSQTTAESKQIVGSVPKGPGRPRGITKIKSIKRDETVQVANDHIRDTHSTHERILQDVTKALTLDTLVGVVDTTKDESVCSTLESTLDSSCAKSLVRDQKSMVLRSRKQTREKVTEDKEQESNKSTSVMVIHSQIQDVTVDQSCKSKTSNLELHMQKDFSTSSFQQPDEEIVSLKTKPSLPSSDTKKRKKTVQESQVKTQEPQLDTVTEVPITKGKRKRSQHLQAESASTTVTTDNPPTDESEMPSVPPQCPTKTKYLPPRKGRGLKYEAMVQKITSPGSKKQPVNIQPDIVPEEPTSKPVPQVPEQKETMTTTEVTHKEGESTISTQETPNTGIQTPRKKRRKWATVESSDAPDAALETVSLVINTPRLAKQKAIKNNHEMHLKQRKKRRKGTEPQENIPIVEQQEPIQTDILPLPPPPFPLPETGEQTQYEKPPTELCLPLIKPKRGRRPSLKKKQEELLNQTEDDNVKEKRKPGPKKKVLNVLKVVVKKPKMKTTGSNDLPPTVKGTLSDLHPIPGDRTCSFRPYVHIDSSLDLASLCTIVNRPEEEQVLSQARKNSPAKMKNLVTVTKLPVSNSSVMLQGPLVNKSLIDRCLTCCLCGKPANYRELGDLCGPYYPEDCIPRKMLSSTHRNDFRQNSNCANETEVSCITEETNSPSACEKSTYQKGANEGHSGHPRRGKRTIREQLRSRPTLRMRFKRLLLLQSRLSHESPPAGEEGSSTALQRLQMEAEEKEHWAHEACAVWTTGIILVAGKLFGLTEAVQQAAHATCSRCHGEGASICCSWKSCTQRYHYVCAKETGCTFQEETFSIRCPKHKAM